MENNMKKTCKYCGIVDENHICPFKRTNPKKEITKASKFRNTKAWMRKSQEIRERDRYLCKVCLRGKYNTFNTFNYKSLEVHHIIPINEDYNLRLENDNLITLCSFHHKMAENGEIKREELMEMAKDKV